MSGEKQPFLNNNNNNNKVGQYLKNHSTRDCPLTAICKGLHVYTLYKGALGGDWFSNNGLYQSSLQNMRRRHETGNRLAQFISRCSLTNKEGSDGWELDSVPLSLHVLRLLHSY